MNLRNFLPETFWKFILRETRPLLYGLNFTFLSSFGQTFLLSLFVPYFIEYYDLTKASFGTIYSGITLTSAAVIPVLGGWIDHAPLKYYSLFVIGGLIAGAFTTAFSWHVMLLVVGLFLLRLSGQGLSLHTAKTAVGRFYATNRGRALSVINLGLPIGEGVLPLVVTGSLEAFSWRMTLVGLGALIGIVFLPLQFFLLETSGITKNPDQAPGENDGGISEYFNLERYQVYLTVLGELRFWFLVPAVVLPGFWITGLFLYQTILADQLGWSMGLLATAFVGYAVARIGFSLGVGPLIDRWSARLLFPFYLVPFALALLFAYYHPGRWSAFGYMSFLGVTMGAGSSIKTALWAELYGRGVLGRVRSLFSSIVVFATSVCPILMGWLLEYGYAIETILAWALLTIVLSTLGAAVGCSLD